MGVNNPSNSDPLKLRYGLWLLLAAVILFAVAGLVRRELKLSLTRELPDGSMLRVAAVSFGTNHVFTESKPANWQLALGRKLPFSLASRLGWSFNIGASAMQANPPGFTNLVLFIIHDGPKNSSGSYQIEAFDDDGNSFDASEGGGNSGGPDASGRHYHLLQSRALDAFPRRCKNIGLRFLDNQSNTTVAEFHIPNPASGTFPVWTPEPLPATREADGVEAKLLDFTTGLDSSGGHGPHRTKTQLTLRLAEFGQTNCLWAPRRIAVSDATGNLWFAYAPASKAKGIPGNVYTLSFPGTLWAGEAAWKLRIELVQSAGFPPEELLTMSNIMGPGMNFSSAFSTNIGGCRIKVDANRKVPGLRNVYVSLAAENMPEDERLILVKVTDDQNRPGKIKNRNEWLNWRSTFDLTMPPDATNLNLEFARHRSRFVEFLASPKRKNQSIQE
jgi:hypothetical protein